MTKAGELLYEGVDLSIKHEKSRPGNNFMDKSFA
jgi:hypothetical protein